MESLGVAKTSIVGAGAASFSINMGVDYVALVHAVGVGYLDGDPQSAGSDIRWGVHTSDARNYDIDESLVLDNQNDRIIIRSTFENLLNESDTYIVLPMPIVCTRSPSLVVDLGGTWNVDPNVYATMYYTMKKVNRVELAKWLKKDYGGNSRGQRNPNRSIP